MSGGLVKKKKKAAEADLDITPMIDVTFLLLIFFMVTSTMQGTPDRDIPPASSGLNVNAAGFVEITVSASGSSATDGEIRIDDSPLTLDQLKAELMQKADGETLKIMIFAERDVKSGFVGEVEQVIAEVAQDKEIEVEMSYAVRDRR